MKTLFLLSVIFSSCLLLQNCNPSKTAGTTRYKAKLETKALCMNYTLRVTEGNIDTSMVATSWTDETTGKTFRNAFALGNPCTFPATIKEGDEFYFVIDTSKQQNQCAVCMAYYPTPPKKLFIKVVDK